MARNKATSPALVSDAPALVSDDKRFVLSPVEVAAADGWRLAAVGETDKAVDFYKSVIVAHGVELAWLAPQPAGEKRGNAAQAAFDFCRKLYAVAVVGLEVSAKLFDRNVKGDEMLHPANGPSGRQLRRSQVKRNLWASLFGTKEWGSFVSRMLAIQAEIDGGEAPAKRGRSVSKSDAEYVADAIAKVLARLRRDAEKLDGTIPLAAATSGAKLVEDAAVAAGFIKRK